MMHSGTGYMARLMQAYGYAVGHEILLPSGISAWEYAHPHIVPKWAQGKRRRFEFDHMIYVVRDPLKTLRSLLSNQNWEEGRRNKDTFLSAVYFEGPDRLHQTVHLMRNWQLMILGQNPHLVLAAEKAPYKLSTYLTSKKLWVMKRQLPAKTVNTRKDLYEQHRLYTLDELKNLLDAQYWGMFKEHHDFYQSILQ